MTDALEEELRNLNDLVRKYKQRVVELSHELLEAPEGSEERLCIADKIAVLEDQVDALRDMIEAVVAQIEQLDRTNV